MQQPLQTVLARALRDAAADFVPDQLAYLAATRKFEDPVRDALAWQLHLQLLERGLTVSREFPMSGCRQRRRKRAPELTSRFLVA